MKEHIIVIGLDGAPWSLISKWIEENKLPTFKKISKNGFIGVLKSTVPSTTFPAVPALLTGLNPANLGVLSFFKADNSPLTLWDIEHKKIWSTLSEQGYSSCVMNIPLSYPPQKINGVMVSGWSPTDDESYTYPKDIKKEIIGFHDDEITKEVFQLRNKKNIEKYRKELLSSLVDIINKRYNFIDVYWFESGLWQIRSLEFTTQTAVVDKIYLRNTKNMKTEELSFEELWVKFTTLAEEKSHTKTYIGALKKFGVNGKIDTSKTITQGNSF